MTKIFKPVGLTIIMALVLSLAMVALPAGAVSPYVVDFSATPTEGSAPLTVQFENLSEILITSNGFVLADNGYSWLWDFGDGSSSTEECPSHTYNCAGIYDVSLTMSYADGYENSNGIQSSPLPSSSETKYGYITVYPVADFSASPTQGQAPLTVNFRDQSTGCPSSWRWSFGDGETSTSRNPSHTYIQGGSYTVSLTVYGSPSHTETKVTFITVGEMSAAAELVVRNLYISAAQAQPRQEVQITAKVANEGGTWGSEKVDLMINGQFEQSVGVGVAPGTAQPVSFTVYKVTAGEYQVQIGDSIGTFYVMEEPAPAPSGGGGILPVGELDTPAIIAIVAIGIIIVGGAAAAILLAK